MSMEIEFGGLLNKFSWHPVLRIHLIFEWAYDRTKYMLKIHLSGLSSLNHKRDRLNKVTHGSLCAWFNKWSRVQGPSKTSIANFIIEKKISHPNLYIPNMSPKLLACNSRARTTGGSATSSAATSLRAPTASCSTGALPLSHASASELRISPTRSAATVDIWYRPVEPHQM